MADFPDYCKQFIPGAEIEVTPGFAVSWVDMYGTNVAASGSITYTFNPYDTTKIYQLQSCNIGAQKNVYIYAELYINDHLYWSGGNSGYIEFPVCNNPSIKLVSTDEVKVIVWNQGTVTSQIHIALNGTVFVKPSGFGVAPDAQFSVDILVADVGSLVTFTDEASGIVSTYDYDFGDGSAHSSLSSPTYTYSVAGRYTPIQTVTNGWGSDYYSLPLPIGIANREDYTTYTEVDAGALLTVAANNIAFAAVANNSTAYVYYDFGANYFESVDVSLRVNVTACAASERVALMRLADQVGLYNAGANTNLILEWWNSAGAHYLRLFGTTAAGAMQSSVTIPVSLSTDYYIRIVKASGSPYVYIYVYSDANYIVELYATYVILTAIMSSKWRYLYAFCSYGAGAENPANGTIYDLRVIDH